MPIYYNIKCFQRNSVFIHLFLQPKNFLMLISWQKFTLSKFKKAVLK